MQSEFHHFLEAYQTNHLHTLWHISIDYSLKKKKNQLCWKHYLLIISYRGTLHLVVFYIHPLCLVLMQCIKCGYFWVLAEIGRICVFVIVS